MIDGIEGRGARAALHGAVDRLAVWVEDRRPLPPEPFRAGPSAPLDCAGPLPPLPAPPGDAPAWSAPSPRPLAPGDRMAILRTPARGPRRGTVVVVPPWKLPRAALVRGWARLAARAGWEAWLVVPPHHLGRSAAGVRSGAGFVSLDLARLRATFEQAVAELRVAAALAAARGPVAIVGLSLGGLAAALAAGELPRAALTALVAPPDLAAVLADTGIGRRYARLAARAGAPVPAGDALREALGPFDPARRPPPRGPALVAAGRFDRIAPPGPAVALARAWGADLSLHDRGHLTLLFACRAVRREVARRLAAT